MTHGNGTLRTLERNRFYYGKLMDVRQWTLEQDYGIDARRLLSRLGFGSGVMCGLGVRLLPNGCAEIQPGVAIDGQGREIVVPHAICIEHPAQPTDCMGRADGEPVTDGIVTISVCYHECLSEPARGLACGCETVERCEHGVVEERYCVRVDRGAPDPREPFPCDVIFPAPPPADFERRRTVHETLGGACPAPAGGCVALATILYVGDREPELDTYTVRRTIYSNQTLFELVMCLAARVDACCSKHEGPVATPPRVMRIWPPQTGTTPAERKREDALFRRYPRVELVLERPVADAVLDAPDDWIRAWAFRGPEQRARARRIELTRVDPPTINPVLAAGPGEQLVVYGFDEAFRADVRRDIVLVAARPDGGDGTARIVVDAGGILLDGEHHGSSLSPQQLDWVWENVKSTTAPVTPPAGLYGALPGSGPPLPSGDGVEGGRLDTTFSFAPQVTAPRLRALWPPSAADLRPGSPLPDERRWKELFADTPRLELTFDDTLDRAALAGLPVEDWLRMFWLQRDDDGRLTAVRVQLDYGGDTGPVLPAPADTATVLIKTDIPIMNLPPTTLNYFVVLLRGEPAGLDADFVGLGLSGPEIDALWDAGTWPGGVPSGPSSLGEPLADGVPGGLVLAYFDYAADA